MAEPFRQGASIILRPWLTTPRHVRIAQTIHGDSLVISLGWPYVVVTDREDLIILYSPEGNQDLAWNVLDGHFQEKQGPRPRGHNLRLLYPGKGYAVSLFFDGGNGVSPFIDTYFGATNEYFRGWK